MKKKHSAVSRRPERTSRTRSDTLGRHGGEKEPDERADHSDETDSVDGRDTRALLDDVAEKVGNEVAACRRNGRRDADCQQAELLHGFMKLVNPRPEAEPEKDRERGARHRRGSPDDEDE